MADTTPREPSAGAQAPASDGPIVNMREILHAAFPTSRQCQELLRSVSLGVHRDAVAALNAAMIRTQIVEQVAAMQKAAAAIDMSAVARRAAEVQRAVSRVQPSPELLKAITRSVRLTEAFRRGALGPVLEFAHGFRPIQTQLQEMLAKTSLATSQAQILRSLSEANWRELSDALVDIAVRPDGSVIAGHETVTLQEVRAAVAEIVEKAGGRLEETAEAQINRLIEETKKLKEPLLQKVVLFVLVPLILLVLGAILYPIAEQYIKELGPHDKRALKKAISTGISERLDRNLLSSFRIVSATALHVRRKPSSTSEVLATLNFGQVVELLERRKSWARVRWANEDGSVSIEGWVFARYLDKFK